MKTFRDYEGQEAIDKIIEAIPLVNTLISDKEIVGDLKSKPATLLGALAVKNHPEECEKLREILGNEPAPDAMSAAFGMSKLLVEVLSNKDIIDFFAYTGETMEKNKSTSISQTSEDSE